MSKRSTENDDCEEIALLPEEYHDADSHAVHRKSTVTRFMNRQSIAPCAAFFVVFGIALVLIMGLVAPGQLKDLSVFPLDADIQGTQSYVTGPPTQSFRDNLRNDTKYITTWMSAGWTNDVMIIGNLIYLAMITERVPIIPRFLPTHVGAEEPYVPFHEVFDILRLSEALRMPILEWDEVKDVNSSTVDELGCWAVWPTIYTQGTTGPRRSRNLAAMNLDVSYTVVPSWVRLSQPSANHGSLWSLARLSFPEGREDAKLDDLLNLPSPGNQVSLPPDDHLLCFDLLYYMGVDRPFEWERDYSPGWRFVGKYMHWNSTLEQLAEEHVRRALDIADREPTPPYIAVHVRHGDFKAICGDRPAEECFAPLSVIARRVAEVQEELLDRKGINVTNVIIASDEQDPNWWADVRALGWTWIDYEAEGTVEKYGKWYPVFLDSIMLSNAAGFVGTDHSTFSFLALRRVQYWNDGAVRTVRFGSPGADNH